MKIKFEDFQAISDTADFDGISSIDVEHSFYFDSNIVHYSIICYFYKSYSWLKINDSIDAYNELKKARKTGNKDYIDKAESKYDDATDELIKKIAGTLAGILGSDVLLTLDFFNLMQDVMEQDIKFLIDEWKNDICTLHKLSVKRDKMQQVTPAIYDEIENYYNALREVQEKIMKKIHIKLPEGDFIRAIPTGEWDFCN